MIRIVVVSVGLLAAFPAFSQALVVATCGSISPPLAVGSTHYLTIDVNGNLCSTVGTTTTREPDSALRLKKLGEEKKK
jgi:hypothetical protein